MNTQTIQFPKFSGVRCLMMPFIQGDSNSLPEEYASYKEIVDTVFLKKGDIGFLTIDESPVIAGKAHRGARAKYERALHTEVGRSPDTMKLGWGSPTYGWGSVTPTPVRKPVPSIPKSTPYAPPPSYGWGNPGGYWGSSHLVTLDRDVKILLANNLDNSCALWDAEHEDTSIDGDIGFASDLYPYESATYMKAGEVHEIGILTPHESLPVHQDFNRQFLRIISSGVHGREEYFTKNYLM